MSEQKGYYKKVEKIIHHEATAGIPEQCHYETIKEYANGGKDVKKVIDVEGVPAKEAWDETVYEEVYIPYTQKELDELRIAELKKLLSDSDYKAIKYAEGILTPEEYAPIKALRQSYRAEINMLEARINIA